ncbi:LacI family DNA-binding transcriptional regulator [Streptococcus sobrinus]|uniref:LacI family DNA-binding transcriptional regulator n=1 Tax=Streptococcus sobrinus TaxID=1310 RepID=UPI0003001B46|nr:LacI family DNA-binding transcriptional regulator [Streptococcus sobrinus]
MVTIKDVAERAGVSPSTVSRTLQDSSAISQKTKDKVNKAMKELGYVPNIAAKMLASNDSHAIGVVLPPMIKQERHSQPFNMEILTVINNEAKEHHYTVSIAIGPSASELEEQIKRMYAEKRVDGFIVLYSMAEDLVQKFLMRKQIPFVILGTPVNYENETTYVDNDNKLMARTAVDYLADRGHRNILFITDDQASEIYLERYIGYRIGTDLRELTRHPSFLFDKSEPSSLEKLLNFVQTEGITALVVIDDLTALKVMEFFSLQGLKVPEDLSLISFNNSAYASILHPYLTSFDINISSLGRISFERILDLIQKKTKDHSKVLVPFKLKERESVCYVGKTRKS